MMSPARPLKKPLWNLQTHDLAPSLALTPALGHRMGTEDTEPEATPLLDTCRTRNDVT